MYCKQSGLVIEISTVNLFLRNNLFGVITFVVFYFINTLYYVSDGIKHKKDSQGKGG